MFPNLFAFAMLMAVTVLASFLLGFGVASAMAEYRQRQIRRDVGTCREIAKDMASSMKVAGSAAVARDPDAAFADALRGQPHDIGAYAYDVAAGAGATGPSPCPAR